jgi:hypothetical protein
MIALGIMQRSLIRSHLMASGTAMTIFIAGSGLICAVMLALGFGFLLPIGSTIGDVCDLMAVGSGIFCVGLLDNK